VKSVLATYNAAEIPSVSVLHEICDFAPMWLLHATVTCLFRLVDINKDSGALGVYSRSV